MEKIKFVAYKVKQMSTLFPIYSTYRNYVAPNCAYSLSTIAKYRTTSFTDASQIQVSLE